jgi:hypothetical protein
MTSSFFFGSPVVQAFGCLPEDCMSTQVEARGWELGGKKLDMQLFVLYIL